MIPILLTGWPLANAFYAFHRSDGVGKFVVLLLAVASIYAWSIIVSKALEVKKSNKVSDQFMRLYRKQPHLLTLYLKKPDLADSPLFCVYEDSCEMLANELGLENEEAFTPEFGVTPTQLTQRQVDAVTGKAGTTQAALMVKLEAYMDWLAVTVSVSPLAGLFGTVWGVMGAFNGMAKAGSSTLSAVAPGVAGALLTTVVGLLVAIPASVAYNILASKIQKLEVRMDNFVQDFEADVRRSYTMK